MKFIFIFYFLIISNLLGLDWIPKDLHLETTVIAETIEYESKFIFKNSSNRIVNIVKIKPSCGCTIIDQKKKIFKPGESGEINFKVSIPENSTKFYKVIQVDTDESDKVEYNLSFTINRPLKPGQKKITLKKVKVVDLNKLLSKLGKDTPPIIRKIFQNSKNFKIQVSCPYLRTPIINQYYHDAYGLRIYTCCKPCLSKVINNPNEAIIKLAQVGQFPVALEGISEINETELKNK